MKLKKIEKLAMEGGNGIYFSADEGQIIIKGIKKQVVSVLVVIENNNEYNTLYSGTDELDTMLNAKRINFSFGCNCNKQELKFHVNKEKNKSDATYIVLKFANTPKMFGVFITSIMVNDKPYMGIFALHEENDYEAALKLLYRITSISNNENKCSENNVKLIEPVDDKTEFEELIIFNDEGEDKHES